MKKDLRKKQCKTESHVVIPTRRTSNKTAFTLAEVLITLGIIGVVAALTMPTLIQNYQKKVCLERFKKSYTILANALSASQYENETMANWNLDNLGNMSDYQTIIYNFLSKYINPYLNISHDCGTVCQKQKNIKRYYLDGTETSFFDPSSYIIYLNDGTIWKFDIDNNSGLLRYVRATVDTNGDKLPNTYGKDIFVFRLYDSGLNPDGIVLSRTSLTKVVRDGCNKEITGDNMRAGYYCAALIVKDGWKFSDDYPW